MTTAESPEIIVDAQNLSKTFFTPHPSTLFSDVSLTVLRGETVAIGGRSGAGKSTLLQILGTLDSPSAGLLSIAGILCSTLSSRHLRNQCIGFIFQNFYLLEEMTVLDNVLMPARIARADTSKDSEAYKRALMLLERVGMEGKQQQLAKLLSGGEKQRVAVARALLNKPKLLLADEPTGNFDHTTGAEVEELLFSFAKEQQSALIVVSHDHNLLNRCHRRYQLQGGQLQEIA